MSETMEFTDRYKACGIPYPDPATMCRGQCEGMGCVPHKLSQHWAKDDLNPIPGPDDAEFDRRWLDAHAKIPLWKRFLWWTGLLKFDGWHFVVCPRCEGTRLEPPGAAR